MGSENRANIVAQMNDSDREQLFSQSWDGSNISKNYKKNKETTHFSHAMVPRCPTKCPNPTTGFPRVCGGNANVNIQQIRVNIA